jgi:RNA polymerase sigma factor (sigma-70 family)
MSDFNLQVTVRNARLLRAIRAKFKNVSQFSKAAGISASRLSALLTMRESPFRQNGDLTVVAEAVCSALNAAPDDLWPKHIAQLRAKTPRFEVELDAGEFQAIAGAPPDTLAAMRGALDRWLPKLDDRSRRVLLEYYGGATLRELSTEIGVTQQTVHRIIDKAERQIRHAARRDGVRSLGDIL